MDLSQFDTRQKATSGVDIALRIDKKTVRGDDGQPMMFRLRGIDSAPVQEVLQKVRSEDGDKTIEQSIKDDIEFCLAGLAGWSDNVKLDGKSLPYSDANARKILGIPVIRAALVKEIQDRANFMTAS